MKIDCTHPNTFHAHGTKNSYVLDKCRCQDCRNAVAAYARQARSVTALHEWDQDQPATPTDLVDAAPVRAHFRRLSAAGIGWKRVCEVAGVPDSTAYVILWGKGGSDPKEHRPPRKRVRRSTADKILAVQPTLSSYRDGAIIPPTGTMRRLQALMTLGYSIKNLGERLDILPANMRPLVRGTRGVRLTTAKKVAALYEQLWDQPRTATTHHEKVAVSRALNYARQHDYAPPAAWDNIDNPDEQPTGTRTEDSTKWQVEDVEHLLNLGVPAHEIAARLGLKPISLYDILRRRLGRDDLAQHFTKTGLDERSVA